MNSPQCIAHNNPNIKQINLSHYFKKVMGSSKQRHGCGEKINKITWRMRTYLVEPVEEAVDVIAG